MDYYNRRAATRVESTQTSNLQQKDTENLPVGVDSQRILQTCREHLFNLVKQEDEHQSDRLYNAEAILSRWYLVEGLIDECASKKMESVNTASFRSGRSDQKSPCNALAMLAAESPKDVDKHSNLYAPLGYGLHRVTGSAFKLLSVLLNITQVPYSRSLHLALWSYLQSVSCHSFIRGCEHSRAVAGAVTCGLLYEVQKTSLTSEHRMTRRLADLLDVCDLLSLDRPENNVSQVGEYIERGQYRRARRLLEARLSNDANDLTLLGLMARLECNDGSPKVAIAACENALKLNPNDTDINIEIATPLAMLHRYGEAVSHLQTVVRLNPDATNVMGMIEQLQSLDKTLSSSRSRDEMPEITPDSGERDAGLFHPFKLSLACYLYRKHGTLLIKDVFDQALIEKCHAQFVKRYSNYFSNQKHADALQIGSRRFQVSVSIEGAFNDPEFFANPFVLQIMHELIGKKVIIGSTVCATSLPGSSDQHLHKDHRALFTKDAEDTPMDIPPVAITTMIPLVPLDEQVGTTVVRKGSHRLSRKRSDALDEQAPLLSTGSCFLMDLALSHKGQGNKTNTVRPIINMVYQQHWFADNKNFKLQPPLHVSADEFQRIPKQFRSLFGWADQPFADVNS